MFVRVFRGNAKDEILINTNLIWKIEVLYATLQEGSEMAALTTAKFGVNDPNAVRFYKAFVGDEVFTVRGNPDDPAVKVFEEIYKSAVKN